MRIDIAYSVSNEFVPILSASIASVLKNADDEDLYFHILNSDISLENKRKLLLLKAIKDFNIDFIDINPAQYNWISDGINQASNFRLSLGSLFPQLEKILFFDSDLIIISSLKRLWMTDISKYYFAAVVDPGIKLQRDYTIADDSKFPPRRFNTGLMLVNLVKWRKDSIEEKLIAASKWYCAKYELWPDQNLLNHVCMDYIYELSPIYNACPVLRQFGLYQDENAKIQAFDSPIVVHFCGRHKVWEVRGLDWSELFYQYARETPFYEDLISYRAEYINRVLDQNVLLKLKSINIVFTISYFWYRFIVIFCHGKTKKRIKERINFLNCLEKQFGK